MYSNTNLKQSLILRSKLVSDQRTLLLHHHLPQHSSVDVWRDQGFDWSESRPPHHQGSIVAFNKRSDHHFGLSFIIYHLERYSVALHDEERDATVTAVPSIDQQSGDYAQPSVRPLSTWNKRQFQQVIKVQRKANKPIQGHCLGEYVEQCILTQTSNNRLF